MIEGDVVKCRFCHKYFKRKSKKEKYCSSECYIKDLAEMRKKNILVKKVCPICKREFETMVKHKKYCSMKCSRIAAKRSMAEKRKIQREDKAIRELNVHLKPKPPKKHISEIETIAAIAAEQKVSAGLVREYYPDRLDELYRLAKYKRMARGLEK